MIRWWVLLLEGFLGDISHLIPSGGISCIPVFVWSCYSLVSSEQSQSSFFPGSIPMLLAPSWAGFANPEPKSGCFSPGSQERSLVNVDRVWQIWRGLLNPNRWEVCTKGKNWHRRHAEERCVMVWCGTYSSQPHERGPPCRSEPQTVTRQMVDICGLANKWMGCGSSGNFPVPRLFLLWKTLLFEVEYNLLLTRGREKEFMTTYDAAPPVASLKYMYIMYNKYINIFHLNMF